MRQFREWETRRLFHRVVETDMFSFLPRAIYTAFPAINDEMIGLVMLEFMEDECVKMIKMVKSRPFGHLARCFHAQPSILLGRTLRAR